MDTIDSFLSPYTAASTINIYRAVLRNYFNIIASDPNTYFTPIHTNEEYQRDVTTYFTSINNRPPNTIASYTAIVKTFLIDNGVELPTRFYKNLRRKVSGSGSITEDEVPTPDQLKRIIMQMTISSKTYFLMLVSSGCRGGELLSLKLGDIDSRALSSRGRILS
jgi:integrase